MFVIDRISLIGREILEVTHVVDNSDAGLVRLQWLLREVEGGFPLESCELIFFTSLTTIDHDEIVGSPSMLANSQGSGM